MEAEQPWADSLILSFPPLPFNAITDTERKTLYWSWCQHHRVKQFSHLLRGEVW